jgi:heme-degrading monooxygenase HmoA
VGSLSEGVIEDGVIAATAAKIIATIALVDAASAAVAASKISTSNTTRVPSPARRDDCGAIHKPHTTAISTGAPAPRASFASQLLCSWKPQQPTAISTATSTTNRTASFAAFIWREVIAYKASSPRCHGARFAIRGEEQDVVHFRELDDRVPFAQQLGESGGPIVFMNTFHVAPEDVGAFMEAWTADGEFMKQQPGLRSTQLHRGIAGSTTFINVAEWDSIEAFRAAASSPEFQASLARYPDSAVASPHIFNKVAVAGISAG